MNRFFCKFLILFLSFSTFIDVAKSLPKDKLGHKNNVFAEKEKSEIKLYKLGVGDQITVDIKLIKNLTLSVLPDGTINLPRVGSLYIKDLSINETKNLIKKSYSSILRNPEVYVNLIATRPILITISGEVQKPGIYSLDLNRLSTIRNSDDGEGSNIKGSGWPTVVDAIQKAGGLTTYADLRSIKVSRFNKGSLLEPQYINLANLIAGKSIERLEPIYDGDSINVPKAESIKMKNLFELSRSNIAPANITVNVIGEVKIPGMHTIQSNSTITQAIFAAGGFNRRANKKVKLIRLKSNGSAVTKNILFQIDGKLSSETYPALKDRDTIFISRNFWSSANDKLQDAVKPINPIVNSYSLYKILNND